VEPTEENLRAWDAAHRASTEPVELPTFVQRTLGDLKGKRVLHLLCGAGEATAAIAELGAEATGVDPRPAALEAARARWPKILWVDGDPQSLPRQLRRGRFDLVYSGEGVLGGLDDLDGWALGIASALRTHGEALVFDDLLRWRSDYFRDPADPERLWRMGQVVSALARAGLHVEALEEYPGGTSRRRHDRRIPATFLLYARRAA
jgi:SAM-dependent methyltransferase